MRIVAKVSCERLIHKKNLLVIHFHWAHHGNETTGACPCSSGEVGEETAVVYQLYTKFLQFNNKHSVAKIIKF